MQVRQQQQQQRSSHCIALLIFTKTFSLLKFQFLALIVREDMSFLSILVLHHFDSITQVSHCEPFTLRRLTWPGECLGCGLSQNSILDLKFRSLIRPIEQHTREHRRGSELLARVEVFPILSLSLSPDLYSFRCTLRNLPQQKAIPESQIQEHKLSDALRL